MSRWAPTPWPARVGPGWRGRGEVADHLEQHLGRRDGGVERRRRQLEGHGEGPQQRVAEPLEVLHPRRRQRAQLGQVGRPQVRAAQAQPGRLVRAHGAGGQLTADVELIAQIDLAVGALVPEAGVAAELRRPHVLDRQPLVLRQGEEAPGDRVQVGGEGVGDAVADDVEEADLVDGPAEVGDEGGRGVRRLVGAEGSHVEHGEAGVGSGYGHVSVLQVWPGGRPGSL